MICHICDNNVIYKDYKGTKLLDEDGNKPCFECFLESDEASEQEETENV